MLRVEIIETNVETYLVDAYFQPNYNNRVLKLCIEIFIILCNEMLKSIKTNQYGFINSQYRVPPDIFLEELSLNDIVAHAKIHIQAYIYVREPALICNIKCNIR